MIKSHNVNAHTYIHNVTKHIISFSYTAIHISLDKAYRKFAHISSNVGTRHKSAHGIANLNVSHIYASHNPNTTAVEIERHRVMNI